MKRLTFYDFMISDKVDGEKYVAYRNVINDMPKFPKANIDRKTIESAIKRFLGDTFDEVLFDKAWSDYENARTKAELDDMLNF